MEPVVFKNEVWEIMREISGQMDALFRPCYEAFGLTAGQARILCLLSGEHQTGVTTLSRMLSVTPGNLSVACKRLEARGFLLRERDREDERVVWVSLSEKGMDAALRLQELLESRCSLVLGDIPSGELETIIEGMRTMSRMLNRARRNIPEDAGGEGILSAGK